MPPPAPDTDVDGGNSPSEVDSGVPAPDIQHVSVPANGLTFEVYVAGPADGEPVLLLHGFGSYARSWIPQIDVFAGAGYRVVAPNLRSYSPGARPADVAPLSVPHPNALVWQVLDPDSCQARASSYGDTFAADNAEEQLLADDAAELRKLWTNAELHGDEVLPQAEIDDRVAFYRTEGTLTGALNWYRANTPFGWLPVVPSVSVPVLFVWGDEDFSICRESAETNRDYVTGPYRFEIFAGHGHWLPEFGGARLNELLLQHFRAYPIAR
jgi:pimeloyl-ACP methyl ester carboxylesterase